MCRLPTILSENYKIVNASLIATEIARQESKVKPQR